MGPLGLPRYSILFWDFDGVIKESLDIKTQAFAKLFAPFGTALVRRVCEHHESNSGMSRFRKIPIYLQWAGVTPDEREVGSYCQSFAVLVRQAVIDSAWVPGAREYLIANPNRQRFVLLTATPQKEMEEILKSISIAEVFAEVHGAPTEKRDAIASVLSRWGCERAQALVIGDSQADREAAESVGVDFLLRRTRLNGTIQRGYRGPQCENFLYG